MLMIKLGFELIFESSFLSLPHSLFFFIFVKNEIHVKNPNKVFIKVMEQMI